MLAWLSKHRTKLTGAVAMLVGAVQVNFYQVRNLIPAKYHGLILFSFGMITAVIGFVNSSKNDAPK